MGSGHDHFFFVQSSQAAEQSFKYQGGPSGFWEAPSDKPSSRSLELHVVKVSFMVIIFSN